MQHTVQSFVVVKLLSLAEGSVEQNSAEGSAVVNREDVSLRELSELWKFYSGGRSMHNFNMFS